MTEFQLRDLFGEVADQARSYEVVDRALARARRRRAMRLAAAPALVAAVVAVVLAVVLVPLGQHDSTLPITRFGPEVDIPRSDPPRLPARSVGAPALVYQVCTQDGDCRIRSVMPTGAQFSISRSRLNSDSWRVAPDLTVIALLVSGEGIRTWNLATGEFRLVRHRPLTKPALVALSPGGQRGLLTYRQGGENFAYGDIDLRTGVVTDRPELDSVNAQDIAADGAVLGTRMGESKSGEPQSPRAERGGYAEWTWARPGAKLVWQRATIPASSDDGPKFWVVPGRPVSTGPMHDGRSLVAAAVDRRAGSMRMVLIDTRTGRLTSDDTASVPADGDPMPMRCALTDRVTNASVDYPDAPSSTPDDSAPVLGPSKISRLWAPDGKGGTTTLVHFSRPVADVHC